MNANRILYRTRQFWQALGASLTLGASLAPEDRDLVQALLTPGQIALFEGMQESEQAHALRVLHALLEQGEEHPDLSVAALLHDVGKSRFPLKLWERILIVLGQAFFPERAKRWGAAAENAAWVQGSGGAGGLGSGGVGRGREISAIGWLRTCGGRSSSPRDTRSGGQRWRPGREHPGWRLP